MRPWRLLLAVAVLAALAVAPRAAPEQSGTILAVDLHGRLLLLHPNGTLLRPVGPAPRDTQGLDLAPGGRVAYLAVQHPEPGGADFYQLDVGSGKLRLIAHGLSPALGDDGRLAYLRTVLRNDIRHTDALVVRTADGRSSAFPLGPSNVGGTPPSLIVNWSPSGRKVAFVERRGRVLATDILDLDGGRLRLGLRIPDVLSPPSWTTRRSSGSSTVAPESNTSSRSRCRIHSRGGRSPPCPHPPRRSAPCREGGCSSPPRCTPWSSRDRAGSPGCGPASASRATRRHAGGRGSESRRSRLTRSRR
jgi:hypothetical protein